MSRANQSTLLSLDRFARILNISPVHFSGAYGSSEWQMRGHCSDLWPQHAWQSNDIASREMVAEAIHQAEEDIMRVIGYSPAPKFFVAEPHVWPTRYDGFRHNGFMQAKYAKVISPGRRAVTLVDDNATVTYSDPDVDSWNELATITASTTLTEPKEIKLYFAGHAGDPEWEIRPLKSVTISGGTVTIKADSWLFIKPGLWEVFPTGDDFSGIDVTTTANYVTVVDVYREYVDTSVPSAVFWWAQTLPCDGPLGITEQNGMFVINDVSGGWLNPIPADYDAATTSWESVSFTDCVSPTGVKLYYYAGDQDERYLAGKSLDPLSPYWAEAIAWLAVSRLEIEPCDCGAAQRLFKEWRNDAAQAMKGQPVSIYMDPETVSNPWGTRVGAIRAWNRARRVAGENAVGGFAL